MKSFSLAYILGLLALMATLSIPAANGAKQREQVILVLDASGSMWGQIDGEPKISIAKNVVRQLVDSWDPDLDLGLVVYGHRRKGDCSDIESLIEPGMIDQGHFSKVLEGINPKGKTPLSEAVIQAANAMRYVEEKATVILLSDGLETCDRDPCAVGEELEKSGIDFTAHVIGFDLDDAEQREQLECLAGNTGGSFFPASDASSLKQSLESAVEKAADPTGVRVQAVMKAGEAPIEEGLSWEVFEINPASPEKRSKTAYSYHATPKFQLAPGRYLVQVKRGSALATREIQVEAGLAATEELVLGAGHVRLVAMDKDGGEVLDEVSWEVFTGKEDGFNTLKKTAYSYADQPVFSLLAGDYTVRAKRGSTVVSQVVSVEAGEEKSITVILGAGQVKLRALPVAEAEPYKKVSWEVFQVSGNPGFEKRKKVSYSYNATPDFTLPGGEYEVQAVIGAATAIQKIQIVPGEQTSLALIVNAGEVKLEALHVPAGEPLSKATWDIFRAEDGTRGKKVSYSYNATPLMTLNAGAYIVAVKRGATQLDYPIVVEAGSQRRHQIVLNSGEVKLQAVLLENGAAATKASWNVFLAEEAEGKGKKMGYSYNASPVFTLPQGRYLVEVKAGGAGAEQLIEVRAGEQRQIDIPVDAAGVGAP